MKFSKKAVLILLVLALFLQLFSCTPKKIENPTAKSSVISDAYFDTVSMLYDYSGLSNEEFYSLCDEVNELLSVYNKLYDAYSEYSGTNNIMTVNNSAGKGKVKVDKKIVDLLEYSKEMYELTNGRINVAMGAVLKLWHECRYGEREDGERIPPTDELLYAAQHVDINNLIIDKKNLTVELTDPEMSLDVGAIGKGYAVEMIARHLEARGYSSIVLDVGGNLRAIGSKPNGDGWSAGVRNPFDPNSQTYVYKTTVKNEALVTSGSYQRYYTVDGVHYHHIINNETLAPVNYYVSVSIKSPSSALCDALSTAIFNMPPDEAREFVKNTTELFVVLVFPDGEIETLGE